MNAYADTSFLLSLYAPDANSAAAAATMARPCPVPPRNDHRRGAPRSAGDRAPLPVRSRYATRVGPRTASAASPFGETFT